MNSNQKVWVIDPVQSQNGPGQAQKPNDSTQSKEQASPAQTEQSIAGAASGSGPDRSEKKNSTLLTVLSFALGPIGILTTEQGRRSKFWMPAAIGSVVVSSLYAVQWRAFVSRFDGNDSAILAGFLIACAAIIVGLASWTHAALLIARSKRSIPARLPQWIKKPWMIGSLGFLLPGFGLFIAGRSRRAVCALWSGGVLLLSALVLSNGSLLWNLYRDHGSGVVSSTVELAILAICAAGFIGGVGWIVQALDGVRLSGGRSTRRGQSRSDLLAGALLLAIAAFFVTFESEYAAEALDSFAALKHQDGLQIIPAAMTLGAMHLDPSRPEYTLHAIQIFDQMGREESAGALRRDLRDRMAPCAGFMQECGLANGPSGISSLHREGTKTPSSVPEGRSSFPWTPATGRIDSSLAVH